MAEMHSFFAPCARGVDRFLADELRAMRIRGVRPQRTGVSFTGTAADAYRVLMWSRLAARVLMHIAQVDATSDKSFYEGVRKIAWEDHFGPTTTFAVYTTGTNDALRNSTYTNVRTKDAVVDRLRDVRGSRPNVDAKTPDLSINVVVWQERAKISLDLTGDALHQRGYRTPGIQTVAPLKETLAASILAVAGWGEIAKQGGAFVDPMVGSGTLAIEAAMVAADYAPGLLHRRWGFTNWPAHDARSWDRIQAEAVERRDAGLAKMKNPIVASDTDLEALKIAHQSIRRAGLTDKIDLFHADMRRWAPAESIATKLDAAHFGLIAINPPYGERLGTGEASEDLCAAIGTFARTNFMGYRLAVIHPSPDKVAEGVGVRATSVHELYNGPIAAPVSVFTVQVPRPSTRPGDRSGSGPSKRPSARPSSGQNPRGGTNGSKR